jgi:hypothetical protein
MDKIWQNLPVRTNFIICLGLQLDSQLSWQPRMNFLLHKLISVCFTLSPILNIQTLRTVYFAHFHSLVIYGITFWGNTSSMRKVFLIQRKVSRIMLRSSSWSSYRKWFKKLESLPIPSLYIHSLMVFFVDNMHYLQTNSSLHDINRRYKNQLHIHLVRLSAFQRSIICSAIKVFNKLPPTKSRLKNDKQFFKSAFKNYFLTHVFILQESLHEIISSFL